MKELKDLIRDLERFINEPTDSGTLNYILSIPGVEYLKLGTTCGSYKFTKENIDELIRIGDE